MSAGKKKVIKDPIWNLFTDNFMHGDTAEERKKERKNYYYYYYFEFIT